MSKQLLHCVTSSVSWSIVPLKCESFSRYGTDSWQKVQTDEDVTVIRLINFAPGLVNMSSVFPRVHTSTDTMTDFEKVERVRRRTFGRPTDFHIGNLRL